MTDLGLILVWDFFTRCGGCESAGILRSKGLCGTGETFFMTGVTMDLKIEVPPLICTAS